MVKTASSTLITISVKFGIRKLKYLRLCTVAFNVVHGSADPLMQPCEDHYKYKSELTVFYNVLLLSSKSSPAFNCRRHDHNERGLLR